MRTIYNSRNQPPKKYQKANTESLSESFNRILSAQKLKNNELSNRLNELKNENEKLIEEIKTLKRVHKREEIAIRRFENQDNDVGRIVKNHIEEAHSLKEALKKAKTENKKLSGVLIEKEEEIRSLKKKSDELRKVLNDKKLMDSVELTKQLEQAEKDMANLKHKCESLEKRNEIMEKNHKHEIGVEIAHHKETQKNLNRVNQELKELKIKLEVKVMLKIQYLNYN